MKEDNVSTHWDNGKRKLDREFFDYVQKEENGDNKETVLEISDLLYHITVMMVNQGIDINDVYAELEKRSEKTGNLKQFHQVDKNT